jgi:hypothetical protein
VPATDHRDRHAVFAGDADGGDDTVGGPSDDDEIGFMDDGEVESRQRRRELGVVRLQGADPARSQVVGDAGDVLVFTGSP